MVPSLNGASIFVALGMLGAIVMPHNIYVHSNVIQSRDWDLTPERRRRVMNFELIDTTIAMGMGWLVNSAMIIVAAAVFYRYGAEVTSIEQASETLEPLVGSLARFMFGIALLVAGLASSITSSLAEANVVTGYLGKPEDPRSRAYRIGLVVTSLPAMFVIVLGVDTYRALIASQVMLSIQLPFTILPLLWLSRSRRVMGDERMGPVQTVTGMLLAGVIIGLNVYPAVPDHLRRLRRWDSTSASWCRSRGPRPTSRCWSTSPSWPRSAAPRSPCCAWRTSTPATSAPARSRTPRATSSAPPRSCARSA